MSRILTAQPAVWGENSEAVHHELTAVHMYLHQSEGVSEVLRAGDAPLRAYAECLTSGLQRLPTYRGAVLRGIGKTDLDAKMHPGQLLTTEAPLSGLKLDSVQATAVGGAAYAIWSITGRRVQALQGGDNEIVFAPGAKFRVLDVRTIGGNPFVLLRQVPATRGAGPGSITDDADETALARLEQELARITFSSRGEWPERYTRPIRPH
ncbi:hypothetical protein ACFZBE_40450 [Streptomyces sp. NPDC008061]|uniref:hypothetical protein n=1 Tax=Streptomyces sp. NPDC008061 TaxID=3364805 RepID=UPI0036E73EEB